MLFAYVMSWLGLRSDSRTNFPKKRKIRCYWIGSFLKWNPTCKKPSDTLFDQNIDFGDLLMATQQNEAKDLDAKVHSHIKAKSAVEAPRGETSPMGKLKAEVTELLSTLKAGNVTKANKASGNLGSHSWPPSTTAAWAMTTTDITGSGLEPTAARSSG